MENQATIREKILRAAEAAFREDGFQAASLAEIAKAAGLTKGAVYSNFKDKDDLLLTVLEGRVNRSIARFRKAASAEGRDTIAFMAEFLARAAIVDAPWSTVFAEFALHASRRPSTAKALAAMRTRLRAEIIILLRPLVDDGQADDARLDRVATLFFAISNGLTLERMSDRSRIDSALYREALESLLHRSRG
ncbi:MAG: TetR family transcriptional regulator [Rhizomicrobium sp.]